MKVYVVRHGVTQMNRLGNINGHLDDVLLPEGEDQARAATLLVPDTFKRIYASSLTRARRTAEIINERFNVPISFHDELREVNFGDLNGTPFLDEYKKRHKAQDYDWRPSGECFDQVKERVLSILEKINNENNDGEALIVAHGGIVRLMHLLECGEPMGEIENASMYEFDLDKILMIPELF